MVTRELTRKSVL
uniref:Uncharacterized protein n=1 Tax=Rhizophora mucronata TaxID=61149 RepID=A0A2P2NVL3_RHIMU